MAKRKTKSKSKPEKNFMPGWSDCGDLSQLELDTAELFPTLDAAKKYIESAISKGDYSAGLTYFIVQIVAKSRPPKTLTW